MKEVILLGTARCLIDCPFDCEVWGVNGVYKLVYNLPFYFQLPSDTVGFLNKLFIMHKQVYIKGKPAFDWDEINEYSEKHRFEVISLHKIPELKSTIYPWVDILNEFNSDYHTSSFDYMIALAIYEGYKRIRFYGVEFSSLNKPPDCLHERLGAEYWIGRAHERGIEIILNPESTLLTTTTGRPYAFDG